MRSIGLQETAQEIAQFRDPFGIFQNMESATGPKIESVPKQVDVRNHMLYNNTLQKYVA